MSGIFGFLKTEEIQWKNLVAHFSTYAQAIWVFSWGQVLLLPVSGTWRGGAPRRWSAPTPAGCPWSPTSHTCTPSTHRQAPTDTRTWNWALPYVETFSLTRATWSPECPSWFWEEEVPVSGWSKAQWLYNWLIRSLENAHLPLLVSGWSRAQWP